MNLSLHARCLLQTKTLPDSKAESLDSFCDFLFRGSRKGRTEEHVLLFKIHFLRREPTTSRNQDPLFNRSQEYLFFYLEE